MTKIPSRRLMAWLSHPDTHPLVLLAVRLELARRGYEVRS